MFVYKGDQCILGAAMANYGFFSLWLVHKNVPVFKFSSTHFHIHTLLCCLSHFTYTARPPKKYCSDLNGQTLKPSSYYNVSSMLYVWH